MKVLKVIKSIFTWILGIAFFSFVIFMTVLLLNYNKYGLTELGDKTVVIIKDETTANNFKKGDIVIAEKVKIDTVKVGDDIFSYKVDPKGNVTIDYGKVGEIYTEESAITFENGSTYSMEFVAGKPSKVYNGVGKYLSIVESKWGFLFMILVPSFLIFIYEIYALIVEIKYGDDKN